MGEARIEPYGPIMMDPSVGVALWAGHFEGLKVYC